MDAIDNSQDIDTPEGIAINLSIAGPVARAIAWIIDTIIFGGVMWVAGMILALFSEFGIGLMSILYFFVYWFYPVVFEVLSHGATPGKKSLGLRVLHVDGTPVGWAASLNRNLLRVVDFLPFLYGFGLISMLSTKRFQRLGDVVAGTIVVHDQQPVELPTIQATRASPPAYPLSAEEQRAIINFAERANTLSAERCAELANLTKPLIDSEQQSTEQLLELAQWIQGRQT